MPKQCIKEAVFTCLKCLRKKIIIQNKWITDVVILQLLQDATFLPNNVNHQSMLNLNVSKLNRITNSNKFYFMKTITQANAFGFYKQTYRPPDSTRYVHYYYFSSVQHTIPPPSNIYEQNIVGDIVLLTSSKQSTTSTTRLSSTRATYKQQPTSSSTLDKHTSDNLSNVDNPLPTQVERRDTQDVIDITDDCETTIEARNTNEHSLYTHKDKWYSPEARCLFVPTPTWNEQSEISNDQGVFIRNKLRSVLETVIEGHQTHDGWKLLVNVDSEKCLDKITSKQIFIIQRKCKYLAHVINSLLKHYHEHNLERIYDTVSQQIHIHEYFDQLENCDFDNSTPVHSSTIRKVLKLFIANNFKFVLTKYDRWNNLPQIFHDNSELLNGFHNYCADNHHVLSAERAQDYLLHTGIPALVTSIKLLNPHASLVTVKDVLNYYGMKYLCTRTVSTWLNQLGYVYCERKKCYYNDNHEKKEFIQYRKKYIHNYLNVLEINCHRYIQISKNQYDKLVQDKSLYPNMNGYSYTNADGRHMLEFHIDDHVYFQKIQSHLLFGASLSVRKPTTIKPLIIFGQDECIFKQFKFSKKTWRLPDGRYPLLPKDEGAGMMVSAFVSREFGFGLKLSRTQLEIVNRKRDGEVYVDSSAAVMKMGTDKKQPLKNSPFVKFLHYGVNNEGYWCYEDMIIQLEDCVDCLLALFPYFDYYFMFDHSNGHDRMRADGLSVAKCNKYFGGSQPFMRESKILKEDIRNFPATNKLKPGDKQSMQYSATHIGPFYMTESEREERRYDKKVGEREIPLNKDELIVHLKEIGIENPVGSKDKLQKLCVQNNLPTKKKVDKILEGWVGKQKGCFQILYERGWIDVTNISKYTMNGKKDIYGKLIPNTSLIEMMKLQVDFANEETLLESFARTLGVRAGKSPPGHPEVAGEGIEFVWGAGKVCFRFHPLQDKKTKSGFIALVHYCLSDKVLSIERVRSFARRARQYMLAYKCISEQIKVVNEEDKAVNKMSHSLMERCVKLFRKRKTHRSAVDFDNGFIKGVMEKMEGAE
jgi:hypothetical protein